MIKANTEDYSATQFIGSGNNSPETWIPLASPISGKTQDLTISCFLPNNPLYNYYGEGNNNQNYIGLLYLYNSNAQTIWLTIATYLGGTIKTLWNDNNYPKLYVPQYNSVISFQKIGSLQPLNHLAIVRSNLTWYVFWNGIQILNSNSNTFHDNGGTNFTHLVICPSRQSKLRAEIFEDLCVIRGSVWKSNFSKPTDYLPDDLSRYLG